jgi:hypothetical protein
VDYGFAICARLYFEVGERGPMPHVRGFLRLPLALYAELVVALTSFLQTLWRFFLLRILSIEMALSGSDSSSPLTRQL